MSCKGAPVFFLDVDGVLNSSRCITYDFEEGDPTLLFVSDVFPSSTEFMVPLEKSMRI